MDTNRLITECLEQAVQTWIRANGKPPTDYEWSVLRVGVMCGVYGATDLDHSATLVSRETLQDHLTAAAKCTCPKIDVGTLLDELGTVTVPGTPDRDCPIHGRCRCTPGPEGQHESYCPMTYRQAAEPVCTCDISVNLYGHETSCPLYTPPRAQTDCTCPRGDFHAGLNPDCPLHGVGSAYQSGQG